ncbi:hypothetical protein Tco_1123724 [Tanacetum coccineum]|uniref:Glutamic acid-rich protein-like n=1 Tax=Tanacetum coccineum TaxID=301880 RepID=A0ABQ5J4G1_9ASTR
MNLLIAAQVAFDEALVSKNDRVMISKSDMRINLSKTHKEATYQVVLDTLKLSPCYNAFLITADVPKIYMQQFLFTISKIKDSSSYKFNLDNKSYKVGLEVFHEILQTCPRLHKKKFVEPPSHEETVAFIKEVGYKGELESITELYIDHIPFLRKPKKGSKAASQQKKASSVTASDDSGPEPAKRLNGRRKPTIVVIKDTHAMSRQKTTVQAQKHKGINMLSEAALLEEAQMKKAIKKSKQETHFQHQAGGSNNGAGSQPEVPDEPKGQSVDTSEGAGSRPEVPDVSEVMSSDQESENESWGNSEDDDERTELDDDKSIDLSRTNDEEETQEDEFVHTPDDYVPTNDYTHDVDDEEYVCINEELYDDVNVERKDDELANEGLKMVLK